MNCQRQSRISRLTCAMRSLAVAFLFLGCAISGVSAQPPHKLLVVSVDGLDWRYLRNRDAMGLAIPNLRRLLRQGQVAQGVIGVFPTITWPSHTSLITGARPDQHGIMGNRRPQSQGGDYYWTSDLLHVPPLWQCAADHGLTTAAITWPVTVNNTITYDLPEYFKRRNGGSMDLDSIASKATPGLVEAITKMYPSFAQQWMDDRTRTQAVLYLLRIKRPHLILLHLVDLDSEAHDQGPFDKNANAILERSDELIGDMLKALPPDYDFALVSDHGFERVDNIANLPVLLGQAGITGDIRPMGGVAATGDDAVATYLRGMSAKHEQGIGREVPRAEILQYAPPLKDSVAVFEPMDHFLFGAGKTGPYLTPPQEKGDHGFWPTRFDYRSVFLLYGPGVKAGSLPEIQMIDIEAKLASLLGMTCH
jgi:predicted AlkP superfamily pyrophosphatase or phosphodiesterase